MYFANYETIDGIEIIKGVDQKSIDRIQTLKNIEEQIKQIKEFKSIISRNEKSQSYYNNINEAKKSQSRIVQTVAVFKSIPINMVQESDFTLLQRDKYNQLKERISFCLDQIKELRKDLPEINKRLHEKKNALIKENAVFHGMRGNTIDLTKKQYDTILNKLVENREIFKQTKIQKLITTGGYDIIDYRNKTVWLKVEDKWISRKITSLTDTVDITEIIQEDLTIEQLDEIKIQEEKERLESLTPEEKTNELEIQKQFLMSQSINMKNKLEIEGDKDALAKSQAWYTQEVKKLTAIYA